MKIQSSTVAMEGRSTHVSVESQSTTLRVWANKPGGQNAAPLSSDRLSLSASGLSLAQTQIQLRNEQIASSSFIDTAPKSFEDIKDKDTLELEDVMSDEDLKKIRLLEMILERLTGKKFRFNYIGLKDLRKAINHGGETPAVHQTAAPANADASSGPASVGWGIHFHHEESQYMKETVDFQSQGTVQTADGHTIDFQLNYHFSQEYWSSHSIDFKAGDALIDPLVIRLDNSPLNFSSDPVVFDLDIDGTKDSFKVPLDSAGMLFYDRNGNHIADDGSELFGPATGKGFEELKVLDSDQNGWIDESDNAFKDMRIWIRSADGTDRYLGLIEAGVGALFVGSVNTEAGLYDQDLSQLGKMKMSGMYLKENGQPGLIHELDFKL